MLVKQFTIYRPLTTNKKRRPEEEEEEEC